MNDNITQTNSLKDLTDREETIVDALISGFMKTMENAADKINLAAHVAYVRQKMQAHESVLSMINEQRQPILEKMETAPTALKLAYEHHLKMLDAEELAVLTAMGFDAEVAQKALTKANHHSQGQNRINGKFAKAIEGGN